MGSMSQALEEGEPLHDLVWSIAAMIVACAWLTRECTRACVDPRWVSLAPCGAFAKERSLGCTCPSNSCPVAAMRRVIGAARSHTDSPMSFCSCRAVLQDYISGRWSISAVDARTRVEEADHFSQGRGAQDCAGRAQHVLRSLLREVGSDVVLRRVREALLGPHVEATSYGPLRQGALKSALMTSRCSSKSIGMWAQLTQPP